MCYTTRHDYGIIKEVGSFSFTAGMMQCDREILWARMAQLFDNDISPYMEFKNETDS